MWLCFHITVSKILEITPLIFNIVVYCEKKLYHPLCKNLIIKKKAFQKKSTRYKITELIFFFPHGLKA